MQHSHPLPGGVGRARGKGKGRRGGRKKSGVKAGVAGVCGGTASTEVSIAPDIESVPSNDSSPHTQPSAQLELTL